MVFIQGLSSDFPTASFSWTASVTNWRRGIPRSAAFTLAFRRIGSGISRVVFMTPCSHIYGTTREPAAQACQTILPLTIVTTVPPRNETPSNGELRLLESDLFTS